MSEKLLEGLNDEQKEAVTHGEGPLLVVAGPGTGKTRVLTHRVAHLIEGKIARPEEILALTFTDKAAREMEERVDLLVPYGYIETTVATFHAFGDRVLRDHSLELGLSYRGVLTPAEQLLFCTDRLFEFELEHYRPLGSPTKHLQALLKLVSRCKDEAITPAQYLKAAEAGAKGARSEEEKLAAAKQLELARFYQRYQELLAQEGRVDYGDQVLLTLQLLRAHPDVLQSYRKQFRWILVDEFQDTNRAQFELLKLLAGENGNLTAVGDDDQSIYAFRGAALSNILEFQEVYPDARQITLSQNYRSAQPILDASYRLIQGNNPARLEVKTGVSKRLTSDVTGGEPVVHEFPSVSEEADWVAEQLEAKLTGAVVPGELAVLVRSRAAAQPYLLSLAARGIAYQFSGSEALYEQPEVKTLLYGLRVVADPAQDLCLYHLATSEIYGAPVSETLALLREASRAHRPLYDLLGEAARLGSLSREGQAALLKVRTDLERALERSTDLDAGQLLYQLLTDSGYLRRLANPESVADELKVQNVARLFDRIREFQEVALDRSTVSFVRHLDELIAAGEDPSAAGLEMNDQAVQVLTVHAAKGLEFEVVYLASLVQEIFPARNLGDGLQPPESLVGGGVGEDRLSEERRLCYVAMTRAKKELHLSWSRDLGGKRTRKPSIFLAEAFGESVAKGGAPKAAIERIERFRPAASLPPLARTIADDEPLQLSFRQIEDYRTCPRGYYLRHVLRIPTEPSHALVYGRAVHAAIVEFYRSKLSGKLLTVEQMKEAFRTGWESEGFLSRAHEEARLAAGERLMERFHAQHQKDAAPLFVEKEFHFPVGADRVVGRWDLVGKNGDEVEVRDFKTSDVAEQKKADKNSKESLQLGVYALAYHKVFEKAPERLVLDYVESGLQGASSRTPEQLAEVEAIIAEVAQGIRAADFTPNPDHPRDCICRQFEGL